MDLDCLENITPDYGIEIMGMLHESDFNENEPEFKAGDRVFVLPLKMEATVIKQRKMYDWDEPFWGNVELQYDDGEKGISHSWQLEKL